MSKEGTVAARQPLPQGAAAAIEAEACEFPILRAPRPASQVALGSRRVPNEAGKAASRKFGQTRRARHPRFSRWPHTKQVSGFISGKNNINRHLECPSSEFLRHGAG